MIVKELDAVRGDDRFEKAGRQAEEQMAHYLRRAFADDPSILVFNGIRLETSDDAAQMDHLIAHPYGLIIVESKSVTTKLSVNAQGEWSRWFNGRAQGMASPVKQAERQRDFLRSYLRRDSAVLDGKEVAINARVAISDHGIIDRPKGVTLDELDCVYKADQIPEEVRETIAARKFTSRVPMGLLRLTGGQSEVAKGDPLSPTDLERLRTFLIEHHKPYQRATRTLREEKASPYATSVSSAPVQAVREPHPPTVATNELVAAACAKCQGTHLKLEYKFNFFLRCADCKGATPLVLRCTSCGTDHKDVKKPDTFKDRGAWSIKCSQCERSIPVDVPQPTAANWVAAGG